MKRIGYVAIVLMLAMSNICFAENTSWYWGDIDAWHVDQDLFAPKYNEDRNYTMGVLLEWYGDHAENHALNLFGPLSHIDSLLGFDSTQGSPKYSVSLGNSAFTPDKLESELAIQEDRPYSSILYASSNVIRESETGEIAYGSKLVVGILGLRISEWGQTGIHRASRSVLGGDTPYDPKGWNHQVSDGGEPTFMYQRSWFRRLSNNSDCFDAAYSWDASIGYYTNASVGGAVKIGNFKKYSGEPFWSMITGLDAQGDANRIMNPNLYPEKRSEIYFTAGIRMRVVGYNALLQCQFRKSDVCFDSSDIERTVYETALGFTFSNEKGNQWMFTCNQRSPEHNKIERRAHTWCGVNYYSAWTGS